jgi:hypothetical protein
MHDALNSPGLDLDGFATSRIASMLRGMVAMRNDEVSLKRERVDVARMTVQADAMYAELLGRGVPAEAIAEMVPGVEIFASVPGKAARASNESDRRKMAAMAARIKATRLVEVL